MARLRSTHEFVLSKDSTETNTVFAKVQREDDVTDAFGSASTVAPLVVPPSQSKAVNLQGLTNVKFVYVETDKAVSVALNGGASFNVVPQLAPVPTAAPTSLPGRFYLWTDAVTSILVTNPSSTDTAKVTVVFAGS